MAALAFHHENCWKRSGRICWKSCPVQEPCHGIMGLVLHGLTNLHTAERRISLCLICHDLFGNAGPDCVSRLCCFVSSCDIAVWLVIRHTADGACWGACGFSPVRQVRFATWQWWGSGRERVASWWGRKRIRNRRHSGFALLSVLDHAFVWTIGWRIISRSPDRFGYPVAFLKRYGVRLIRARYLIWDHGC